MVQMKKMIMLSVLCLATVVSVLLPSAIKGEEGGRKVVRVGWYDSTYNTVDENGYRSGYA